MPKFQPSLANKLGEKSQWFTILPATSITADLRIKYGGHRHAAGIMLEIITTNASTYSMTPRIETVDDAGNVLTLWSATAAIAANGTALYVFVQQGGATGLNGSSVTEKVDAILPRDYQIFLDWSAGSATAEIHMAYI